MTWTRNGSTQFWFCCNCVNTSPKSFFTNLLRSADEFRECRKSSDGFRECPEIFLDTRRSHDDVRECEWAWRVGTSVDGRDVSDGARINARDGADASWSLDDDDWVGAACAYSWIGMSGNKLLRDFPEKKSLKTYLAPEADSRTANHRSPNDPFPRSITVVWLAVILHNIPLHDATVEYHKASSQYLSFCNDITKLIIAHVNKKETHRK